MRYTRSLACLASSTAACCSPIFCESELRREYGKNDFADKARDRSYRDSVWKAFFVEYPGRQTQREVERQSRVDLSEENHQITCEELLAAARQGLGFKRAVKLVQLSGQYQLLENCRDSAGRTPVMLASMQGNVDNVDLCLQMHPSPRDAVLETDAHGISPLEVASWKGHVSVVDYLLQRGARSNDCDHFGVAPLHKAVGHGQRRAALRLLQDGSCNVNLQCATPTVPPEYGAVTTHQTALHIACRRHAYGQQVFGDRGMAELLLKWGADPSIRDFWGNTPLHYAAQGGDIAIVRLLLKHGADKRARNNKGELPADLLPGWIFFEAWGASLEGMLRSDCSGAGAAEDP